MPKRLVNNIEGNPTVKNSLLVNPSRGLSIRKNESEMYNLNTVYYFDKLMSEKYENIKTNNETAVSTTEIAVNELVIDETPEVGEKRWL